MSCYNCGGCEQTATMNICFENFIVTGLPNNTLVNLTFESKADGAILTTSGTTVGTTLTIAFEDMPPLVPMVSYKLTFDQTWDDGDCAIVTFAIIKNADGIASETNVTLTVC